jgi:hypothetical protein
MNTKLFHDIQKQINDGFQNYGINKDLSYDIKSTNITYQELEVEIRRIMNHTRDNLFIGNKFHSFFIYGPTGNSKTELVEQIAKEQNFIYHKLEIQKVPIEILQGFPYLVENNDGTIAKLAPSTILPPSNDDRCFVLHFDEFNKADADKMAAVMNLILTGELGGSADFDGEKSIKYTLPRKTVIIGTGNTKCQEAVENLNIVSQMDTATSERWHRSCFLDYNAEGWLENFAFKPFEFKNQKLDTRIPTIILNFIIDKTLDSNDNKEVFLIPIISGSEEGMETERTTSPRAWTLVADAMIVDGYKEWTTLDKSK